MKRNIPVETLKKMANEHLSYEMQMFIESFKKLRRGNLNQYENNAAIEVLLIHARCLLDFLYPPENKRSDDVIAEDFFEDPQTFRESMPPSLPVSEYLKRRTGKELAHLTYDRVNVTPSQKVWNFMEIHDQILKALATFFKHLPEERKKWFTTIVVE